MWRCSLAWAKHQVNVNWDVKRWNQEDRDKLSAVRRLNERFCV